MMKKNNADIELLIDTELCLSSFANRGLLNT